MWILARHSLYLCLYLSAVLHQSIGVPYILCVCKVWVCGPINVCIKCCVCLPFYAWIINDHNKLLSSDTQYTDTMGAHCFCIVKPLFPPSLSLIRNPSEQPIDSIILNSIVIDEVHAHTPLKPPRSIEYMHMLDGVCHSVRKYHYSNLKRRRKKKWMKYNYLTILWLIFDSCV